MSAPIAKIIHYCWFGGKPLPPLAEKCIASWKKYFPDYSIKRWDESNFDVNIVPYTAQAYKAKKYAFVSDYARFWILYKYGGIYFDTDVEVIRSMTPIINNGPFMGCERNYVSGCEPSLLNVAPGLGLGAYPGLSIYGEILKLYSSLQFINKDGSLNYTTVVDYTTSILVKNGLKNIPEIQEISGIKIYPKKYFCPIDYVTGKLTITPETYSIHHYAASWVTPRQRLALYLEGILGKKIITSIVKTKQKIKKCLKI